MLPISESLVKVKEYAKNSKIFENRLVRYGTYVVSTIMIIAIYQKVYVKIRRRYYRLPNGPIGYPLIGCLPQYLINLKGLLYKLPSYGPVSHMVVLGQNIFMINDYQLAKILVTDERLLTRPPVAEKFPEFLPMSGFTNGEEWSEARKLMVNSLQRLTNKAFTEKMVKKTFDEHTYTFIDDIANKQDLFYPADICRHLAFVTIYAAACGKTIGLLDDRFIKFNDYLNEWDHALAQAVAGPTFLQPIVKATTIVWQNKLVDLVNPLVEDSIKTYNENNLETWIHHALYDISAANNTKSNTNKNNIYKLNVTEKDIIRLKGEIIIMFAAGIHTTGYALEYAILAFAKYPKNQDLIYNELIQNKFDAESFGYSKINECPILRAFVNEVLRYSSPAPQSAPRQIFNDVEIEITKDNVTDEYSSYIGKKFVLKGDSILNVNFLYFGRMDGEDINIYNWLKYDENSKTYKYDGSNHPNFFPFSLGKRSCPGENIAIVELYVGIALLVLSYRFRAAVKEDTMDIKTKCGTSHQIFPKIGVLVERR